MFSSQRIVTSKRNLRDSSTSTWRREAYIPHANLLHWLEQAADDPSAAGNAATMTCRQGRLGISVECLRKVVRLSPESLDEVLKGLLASKQAVLLKVNGARVYRAA